MDLSLTSEQREFRDTVRRFVAEHVSPRALADDREERFPAEAIEALKQAGYLGLTIPEEHGGSGADPFSYVLMVEELGYGDANVRSVLSVQLGLVAGPIARFGTDEQKRRWLPKLASGEVLGCFGLTEPDRGSDPANLRATAVRDGDTWRINGSKVFITNGTIAGLALLMARSGEPGGRGVSAFLVPTDTPGFSAKPIHGKLGLRSSDTAELTFDDMVVPADALLGGVEGTGIKVALSALDDGRISMAAACTGLARAALDAMVTYAQRREQFGKPIAAHQLVQQLIADTAVEADAARLLAWAAVDLKVRGEPYGLAASKAKLFASEVALRAANACVQVHGGYGYLDEYPAGKLLRDARVTTLYEGTSQIQQLIIGRALTGISAF